MNGIGDFVTSLKEMRRLASQVMVEIKGDYEGHPFRGNQWEGGSGGGGSSGGSMGDQVANDSHAKKNASITPGKRKMPDKMTRDEYDSLPIVYHGSSSDEVSGHIYVTPEKTIAESHGRVRAYRILPKSKIYPDPEIEGERGKTLMGLESLKHGSAVVHSDDLIPNLNYSSWNN